MPNLYALSGPDSITVYWDLPARPAERYEILLDGARRALAVYAQLFVQFLPVAAALHGVHQNVLGGHEGQVFIDPAGDHPGIDHHAVGHVGVKFQHRVRGQEGLRHADALVGGVVQGALEPLGAGGDGRVEHVDHDVSCQ